MDNKNNKMSSNYKDYKYEYTGYKDFVKKHHLDKKDIKKEKEDIVHDHRLQFDFNNPNQHHHDYNFNFNNPNEHYHDYSFDHKKEDHPKYRTEPTVNSQTTYKQTQPRNYQQTTIYSSPSINNQKRNYNQTKNNSKSGCIVFIILIWFFIIPIISFIVEISNSISTNDDNYNYNYEYDQDNYNDDNNNYYDDNEYDNNDNNYIEDDLVNYTEPYDKALNSYLNAITHLDYNYAKKSLTSEELEYNNGWLWEHKIETISKNLESNTVYSFKYEYITKSLMTSASVDQLNYKFEKIYVSDRRISTAYKIALKLYINQKEFNQYITLGKIDNTWYLIQVI